MFDRLSVLVELFYELYSLCIYPLIDVKTAQSVDIGLVFFTILAEVPAWLREHEFGFLILEAELSMSDFIPFLLNQS